MSHPYRRQPQKAYWKKTVSNRHALDVPDWYVKRFSLDGAKVATAGSCFAQHIGRNMREKGFGYLDAEPAPELLPKALRLSYGYEMYSARYGNVYTSRQLLQLAQRALGIFSPKETHWEKGAGVVDPFRPTIEPEPFGTVAETLALQTNHLQRVATLFEEANVFVFTLGLTEAWLDKADGAAFPLCPGTSGGTFDENRYQFHNLSVADVVADMEAFFTLVRGVNPNLRFLLTVSPVPLMATASDMQVAVATTYSKSVLRAAAGQLFSAHDFVDYFPSYEIVTSPFMKGFFFEPDAREVSPHGVSHVMKTFFAEHAPPAVSVPVVKATPQFSPEEIEEQIRCDEELLDVFSGDAR
ncbi:GSCFA domain-containing protein [Shimia marina]|uniref:GSCFA family protein n=1 Tax=Shimia marina TaxID=321267 RepID=A0A0P1ELA7_9RHOB|nr:GSCFA domain-containing protein [Shimia marina]CUH51154.1 GSCFA family protein [Shimia marina]SFD56608.1 GSCFA family protein [Shimia marina]